MVALTTASTLGGRARQTQGGGTGQQLIALFSPIALFIESINGAMTTIALFSSSIAPFIKLIN